MHEESIPLAYGPSMGSTSQHSWIDLSAYFFYFTFFSSLFLPISKTSLSHHSGVTIERENCAVKLEFGVTACNFSLKGFHCPWLIHILQTFVTEFWESEPSGFSDRHGLWASQCLSCLQVVKLRVVSGVTEH